MHASVCQLLWWLYDDNTAWCMSRYLQISQIFSDMKLVLVSEITLNGNPYSGKIFLCVFIRWSTLNPALCFITRNCCGNLQCISNAWHLQWRHLHQQFPLVCLVFHGKATYPYGCTAWNEGKQGSFLIAFSVSQFMSIKYIESHAYSLIFSIPISLTCTCLSAHLCRDAGIMIPLLFITIPSVTALTSLNS